MSPYPWLYITPNYRYRLPQKTEMRKAIAGIIRRRREELHYTQEDIARSLSMTPSSLCRLESGKRDITACTFIKLCLILGLNLSDFYQREKI